MDPGIHLAGAARQRDGYPNPHPLSAMHPGIHRGVQGPPGAMAGQASPADVRAGGIAARPQAARSGLTPPLSTVPFGLVLVTGNSAAGWRLLPAAKTKETTARAALVRHYNPPCAA